MNKELEALERLIKRYYELCEDACCNDDEYQRNNLTSEYHIIKSALERKEKLEKALKIVKRIGIFQCMLIDESPVYSIYTLRVNIFAPKIANETEFKLIKEILEKK